jgi:hypothetical protein
MTGLDAAPDHCNPHLEPWPIYRNPGHELLLTEGCDHASVKLLIVPPRWTAFWGRFLRDRVGAASLVALAPAGGEGLGEGEGAPTACTLTPPLSLAGRGRSACMAAREKPTLESRWTGGGRFIFFIDTRRVSGGQAGGNFGASLAGDVRGEGEA